MKYATLKLCAVPLVGNVLEKQNTAVLRTVQVWFRKYTAYIAGLFDEICKGKNK